MALDAKFTPATFAVMEPPAPDELLLFLQLTVAVTREKEPIIKRGKKIRSWSFIAQMGFKF
jgi:hypothetical protein